MYLKFQIKVPAIIENIILYFLLRHRKKHHGFPFRRIKLITDKDIDGKYRYAMVDASDYQKLSEYNWLFWGNKGHSCAVRYYDNKIIYMHRVIMNAPKGIIVDHKNGNSLDNTRRNLRFATASQNACNCRRKQKGSSKYRGVRFDKDKKRWRAVIRYNGVRRHLGYFDNEKDAARAYDEAAKIYHGEFAVLNFPPQTTGVGANRNPQ
ncbi:MAG: AP2/ERF family transcription factor [Sedimentisphaerales bacterium]